MNIAYTALWIADRLGQCDIVFLADDDQQAEALAAIVQGLMPERPVIFLPSSDALPGDSAPPSPANAGRRAAALRTLRSAQASSDRGRIALILSGEAAARRYPEPAAFDQAPPCLRPGDRLDIAGFATLLGEIGYIPDDRVDEPGEMAVRGEIVDLFPADAGGPARIEIVDDSIAAIRAYDPATQRTSGELPQLEIGRASEPAPNDPVAILDHLTPGTLALSAKADKRRRRFLKLAADGAARSRSALDAIDDERWQSALAGWTILERPEPDALTPRFAERRAPLAALSRFVEPLVREGRALIVAGSERDLRFLRPRLSKRLKVDLPLIADYRALNAMATGEAGCIALPIEAGFVDRHRVVIAAADLLGSRASSGDTQQVAANPLSADPGLAAGDLVVHEDHGVARVVGLEPAGQAEGAAEMIVLEHAGGARRLVAPETAERIWRYGAESQGVALDRLDGASWEKRRASIEDAIAQGAKALVRMAEARTQAKAVIIDPDPADYERFGSGFPFNETADQARAINAVRDDLASGSPMDRLVIGDVGFGKTEVAMRAAALAALAGYQVVVAAPTTVLVRQHLESFGRRFAEFDIAVAGLSRLSTPAEKKAVKSGLADGSVQIVIGTGAVMAKDVAYARLGLVIIDEEQRFGAADKARLHRMGDIHLLALSATPIPRTLQMAMIGLRQMSVIATPPQRRQPIRTSLDMPDDNRIRTALLREKGRGGQSFVVVPRIEDMAMMADRLRRIVPDLKLVEAHGKMPAGEIDAAMVGFADGDGDVLLATNIIEAGLDVPRANTMIVWRADRFGLSQLHQLRGRVGRGNRRGQVILLTDGTGEVAERTRKRLRTLTSFDRLGAGFEISARDLDMRGGGDLAGDDQAGHMKLIGAPLYQHLLKRALRKARGEAGPGIAPKLNLGEAGSLPAGWIPEDDLRLSLYVRLARIENIAELDAFEDELQDRFGALPADATTLLTHARIRAMAQPLSIDRIDAGAGGIALTPGRGFKSDFKPLGLRKKEGRLVLAERIDDPGDRIARVVALLEGLSPGED